jgi:hypothetical protein
MALTQFWQQQLIVYVKAQAAAQGDLTAAQALQQAANTQLAVDLKSLHQVTGDIAALRAKLAAAEPADATALIAQITEQIIEQRRLQGAVLDGRDALDAATASLEAASTALTRIKARMAVAGANIAQAATDDAQRDALRQAATAEPLSSLNSAAKSLLDAVQAAALTGLQKNFPEEIIDLAGRRYQTRTRLLAGLQGALDNAQDSFGRELAAESGLQGVVSRKLIDLQRAQHTLAQYVATADNRFQKAQAVLQMLDAIGKDQTPNVPGILTAAETAQLFPPAAIATAGATASGVADLLATTTQAAVKKAADDKDDADQAAVDQAKAEGTAAESIFAAGIAAAKAVGAGATPEDQETALAAAHTAADDQDTAGQKAVDKDLAEVTAGTSLAAARDAIVLAALTPNASIIGICLDAVFRAQDDLDAQILTQIEADVDQLSSDQDVLAPQRAAITDAKKIYHDAIDTFIKAIAPKPKKTDLDYWEVIIPDTAWKVLLDYQEGLAALHELSQADPKELKNSMNDAETAYVAALDLAEKAQRKADALGDAIALRAKRLALAQAALANRLPSAIRGDSY